MIRLIVGAAMAAVVLFAWQVYFWDYSGLPYRFMRPMPNEAEAAQSLRNANLSSGTYEIPFRPPQAASGSDAPAAAAYERDRARGPVVEISYHKQGVDAFDAQRYVAGFCHFLAASLLAGILLVLSQPGLPRYLLRVLFVAAAGLFATVAVELQGPIWLHHPWPAPLWQGGQQVIGWLAAGLVLGAVVRPAKAAPPKAPPTSAPAKEQTAPSIMEVAISQPAAPPNP
ncbi:MAG TPA: hypothetical protein VMS17_33155 [Gemmataceae bacterium]|nr:hypothetical protein [Gemmataceae bacterium]